MSSIEFPLVAFIVFANPIVSVFTPTLKESVKLTIFLLNPDITTLSWSFNSIRGKWWTNTSRLSFHSNTAFSNLVKTVSILETPIPTISSTCALNPYPPVFSSLNVVKSPTLYPIPPSKTSIPLISEELTDSIVDNCLTVSLDSIITVSYTHLTLPTTPYV